MKTIGYDKIDFRKTVVFYLSPSSGPVKLQRVQRNTWGFVYLNRPDLAPVFLGLSPKQAIRNVLATLRHPNPAKHRVLYTCDQRTFGLLLAGELAP